FRCGRLTLTKDGTIRKLELENGDVLSTIDDIESIRSTINLHDEYSLCYAKRKISSIRNQINKTFDEQDINNSKFELDRQIYILYKKTLKTIELLLISLNHYQM
ncbi:unnamed protein product, partial [Rotaria sp. Silwood1]